MSLATEEVGARQQNSSACSADRDTTAATPARRLWLSDSAPSHERQEFKVTAGVFAALVSDQKKPSQQLEHHSLFEGTAVKSHHEISSVILNPAAPNRL